MRFLAVVRRKYEDFTEAQIAEYLEPEAERVRDLYMQGVFRTVYSRGDVKGAVVELECASLDEAKQVMETMPFARHRMIDVDIIPLLPYRGFAPRTNRDA
jgi:muconolactone delta-isomerase